MTTRRPIRLLSMVLIALMMTATAATAQSSVEEAVSTFDYTKNMKPLGFSERANPFVGTGSGVVNSDLAFWGKYAVQGHYAGFRIIDISDPAAPAEIVNYEDCVAPTSTLGSQGDIVLWENILVRTWDAPRGTANLCGDVVVPAGQEGSVVFDISDPTAPEALTFVRTPCGSHTATGVPDIANGRLLVYSSSSSNAVNCRGIDILEVPVADPGAASYLRFEPSGEVAPALPNEVQILAPSAAEGIYAANGAAFHPEPPRGTGIEAPIVVVNAGPSAQFPTALPGEGCGPLIGFPAGAIALVDRGTCPFVHKAEVAQAAGAVAVIVANNVAGTILMGGDSHTLEIPSVMVSLADGNTIKAGLPATGQVRSVMPENAERACHDTGVILGDVMKAACAGGNGVSVWSLGGEHGGSLENPELLYSVSLGVGIGHSAAFSWDGDVLIFGHEPGGGGQAQCQATSSELNRTLFFLDAETGHTMGTFIHPRPQGPTENCTWHNYNVVPTDKRHILVSGNYQSGISVIDFTDHDNIHEFAYADPAPLVHPTNPNAIVGGGDWSSYWYNGHIYESDMKRGLIVWKLSDNRVAGAKRFPYLNPQTQETSFPFKGTAHGTGGKGGSSDGGGGH